MKNILLSYEKCGININRNTIHNLLVNDSEILQKGIKVIFYKYHKVRGCLRWKISYPSTRRWLDRGDPRDAGEWYACQTVLFFTGR